MERQQTICLVDDDQDILELLSAYLERHGFAVSRAEDGAALMRILRQSPPDLIVLDIMLPGEDGFSICRNVRALGQVPIIFLSALHESTDRIVGLELGADDYMSKPFEPRELLARIRSVLRRKNAEPSAVRGNSNLYFAGWRLDRRARCLESPHGVMVNLSGAEYRLLMAFLTNPQTVLNRDALLELTQGRSANVFDRSIDVQVSRLRMRLRDANDSEARFIKTVRGDGYFWTADVREENA
jgi:two-component system OmpR family response regulator